MAEKIDSISLPRCVGGPHHPDIMKHRLLLFILLVLFAHPGAAQQLPSFPKPYGIYAIGQSSTANIRDYPFVDGFVMRIDWSLLEPQRDAYDFSAIDAVVRKLDTLGKHLTLDVFRMRTPAYILATPGVQTHVLRLSRDSFYTAVPWDSIALHRFELLQAALGAHRIRSLRDGADVPLRDHPVLRQIDATPIGTNGIRDLNHSLTSHPTYSRPVFIEAILRTAEIVRKHFPTTYCFVALFGIRDEIPSPVLTDVLRDSLLRRINTEPGRPMLGFFQENLSCNGPIANQSNPLYATRDSTFTMYQMLQGWRTPFLDSSKTEACKTDSTGPDVAILKALAVTYGMYFEIYVSDLDYPGYAAMFTRMHDSLARLNSTPTLIEQPGTPLPSDIVLLQNFPNPCSTRTTLRYFVTTTALSEHATGDLRIFDLLGRTVGHYSAISLMPGIHDIDFDAGDLRPGLYIIRLTAGRLADNRVMVVTR